MSTAEKKIFFPLVHDDVLHWAQIKMIMYYFQTISKCYTTTWIDAVRIGLLSDLKLVQIANLSALMSNVLLHLASDRALKVIFSKKLSYDFWQVHPWLPFLISTIVIQLWFRIVQLIKVEENKSPICGWKLMKVGMELDGLVKNCKQCSTLHLHVIVIILKLCFYSLILGWVLSFFFFNLKFVALCQLTIHHVVFFCQNLENH